MDLVHVWFDDKYWSKISYSTIRTPVHDLKVKVMDLDFFLYISFTLKFLGPRYFQTLWSIWFIFGMMTDAGPKILCVPSQSQYMTFRSRSQA